MARFIIPFVVFIYLGGRCDTVTVKRKGLPAIFTITSRDINASKFYRGWNVVVFFHQRSIFCVFWFCVFQFRWRFVLWLILVGWIVKKTKPVLFPMGQRTHYH